MTVINELFRMGGSSGGARPKIFYKIDGQEWIVKFPSSQDRVGNKRIHMLSVIALLETSHRIPNLDYNILMQLTLRLTNDYKQAWHMFRLMCFNVFSHNRDDHSKNFSFLYQENENRWILSPAYDLTFSNSIGGEHATTVDGNGKNPGMKELLAVAKNIKLDQNKARCIAEEIHDIVSEDLSFVI